MGKINEGKHYNMLAVSKSQIIKAGTFEQVSHMEKLYKINKIRDLCYHMCGQPAYKCRICREKKKDSIVYECYQIKI